MLTEKIDFDPAREAEILASVPASPAVFLFRNHNSKSQPYMSKTANLRRRVQRLLGTPTEPSKRLNLGQQVCRIEYSCTGSDFESGFRLYQLLREHFPDTYSKRLRLRFAPLVKLHLANRYPRASITTRLGRLGGSSLYYGPFASRTAAEKFANDSLDFFKLRRCVEDLHPDPSFPGCIYSEMKMCAAPCFMGCTDDQYSAEVKRVRAYFDSRGDSLLRELSEKRDAASQNLEFEEAAARHARVEKLTALLNPLPEIVRCIDSLSALMIQPGSSPNAVSLFRIQAGTIHGPIDFPIQPLEPTRPLSMESRVIETIAAAPSPSITTAETMEHLAILKRWYYRSSKAGEIFFAEKASLTDPGELPLRRIVRGIGRVHRGEFEASASTTVGPIAAPSA